MARRFLDDVRADINAQIIANAAGLITADILRPLMIDQIDSTIEDEAAIGSNTLQAGLAVDDVNWTTIPSDTAVGGDAQFLNVDLAGNQIISAPTAGWTYSLTGLASIKAGNNSVFELAVLLAGVPVGYIGSATTRGVNRPQSLQAYDLEISTPASSSYQLGIRGIATGVTTVDVTGCALTMTIKPTNNP